MRVNSKPNFPVHAKHIKDVFEVNELFQVTMQMK